MVHSPVFLGQFLVRENSIAKSCMYGEIVLSKSVLNSVYWRWMLAKIKRGIWTDSHNISTDLGSFKQLSFIKQMQPLWLSRN